jgi:hypothetical protein
LAHRPPPRAISTTSNFMYAINCQDNGTPKHASEFARCAGVPDWRLRLERRSDLGIRVVSLRTTRQSERLIFDRDYRSGPPTSSVTTSHQLLFERGQVPFNAPPHHYINTTVVVHHTLLNCDHRRPWHVGMLAVEFAPQSVAARKHLEVGALPRLDHPSVEERIPASNCVSLDMVYGHRHVENTFTRGFQGTASSMRSRTTVLQRLSSHHVNIAQRQLPLHHQHADLSKESRFVSIPPGIHIAGLPSLSSCKRPQDADASRAVACGRREDLRATFPQ